MAAVWRSQCAFARIFGGKTRQILNNSTDIGTRLTPVSQSISLVTKNYSNYANSPLISKIQEQYNYEIAKNPEEWKYVERLMPFETIPEVTPKDSYPSGFIPPREEAKDLPFFIERTKNHQLPVYLKLSHRGQSKVTKVRKIEGDIWMLNGDLKNYLKTKNNRHVETRVHELGRFIDIKGDFVNDVRDWAYSKGF